MRRRRQHQVNNAFPSTGRKKITSKKHFLRCCLFPVRSHRPAGARSYDNEGLAGWHDILSRVKSLFWRSVFKDARNQTDHFLQKRRRKRKKPCNARRAAYTVGVFKAQHGTYVCNTQTSSLLSATADAPHPTHTTYVKRVFFLNEWMNEIYSQVAWFKYAAARSERNYF